MTQVCFSKLKRAGGEEVYLTTETRKPFAMLYLKSLKFQQRSTLVTMGFSNTLPYH